MTETQFTPAESVAEGARQAGLLERVHEMLHDLRGSGLAAALEENHAKTVGSMPGPFTHPEVDKRNAELLATLGSGPFALSRYRPGAAPQRSTPSSPSDPAVDA